MGTFTRRFVYIYINFSLNSYNSNVSDENCRENQNTHLAFNNFFRKNRAVFDAVRKSMVNPERPQMITKWITRALHAG